MAKQVPWTKKIVDTFIQEAMLTDLEQDILITRIKGWSTTKQAMEFNISVASVNRIISVLKKKYDTVSAYNDILPARKFKEKLNKD